MPAGQPIFEETTIGGWYQATDNLRQQLISLGLPNRTALGSTASPAPAPASPQPTPAASPPAAWPRVVAVVAALLLAAGAAIALRRRRAATAH
jgi:TRAP-type C4-dicarboxylate transport system permease small subunit